MLRFTVLALALATLQPALVEAGGCTTDMLTGTIVIEPEADRRTPAASPADVDPALDVWFTCTVAATAHAASPLA